MGMLQKKDHLYHWNYFLAIENDLFNLSRFVEFSNDNLQTYSLEMARIIIAASSEIDVIFKDVCNKIDTNCNARNIHEYYSIIQSHLSQIINFEVNIPRFGIVLTPFWGWKKDKPPQFWTACNKIKHHRKIHYNKANLDNTLNSVAALYVITLYMDINKAEDAELIPSPIMLRPAQQHCGGNTLDGFEFGINYKL